MSDSDSSHEDGSLDPLVDYLPALLDAIQDSDVRAIELREGSTEVRIHRAPLQGREAAHVAQERKELAEVVESTIFPVTSPLVGTFYRASRPGQPALVSEGSRVEHETVVGIVEALHDVLTSVEAGCSGVVTASFVTDGQPVEYGQVLFEVEVDG